MLEDSRLDPRMHDPEPVQRCGFPACGGACCLHGAWVDLVEVAGILRDADRIAPHMLGGFEDPADWFTDEAEADPHALSGKVRHTVVLAAPDHYGGTACVFLRADAKCALQVAGEATGEPWKHKPFYCILHPMMLDEQGRITLDEVNEMVAEPASCLHPAETSITLIDLFSEELAHLVGKFRGD
jgi:hypothetical protein